jgi:hypothetical protein
MRGKLIGITEQGGIVEAAKSGFFARAPTINSILHEVTIP